MKYLLPAVLLLLFFLLLASLYRTGKNVRFKQIAAAIVGALLLLFLLYTCNSDNSY